MWQQQHGPWWATHLERVRTSAHTSVQEHLRAASHGRHHLWQRVQRRVHAVELSGPVVRHDDACNTVLDSQGGVLASHDALEKHRQAGDAFEPLHIRPLQAGIHVLADELG